MSTVTIVKEETFDVKFLSVQAGVRYWEDAVVNGENETDESPTIPCRNGSNWSPLIEIDTGRILDWPQGTTASVHYKVCDAGRYALLDADMNEVFATDGYVPSLLSPGGSGYGDYIIMDIGPDGLIANWKIDLDHFEEASREATQ